MDGARTRDLFRGRSGVEGLPQWAVVLVVLAGAYAIAAGATTLVGWATDTPRLTDWKNDGISMFPNTAMCAIVAGLALLSAVRGEPARAHAWLALLVGVIGGLTLVEHLSGVDLGIDTLLFQREWGQGAAAAPMRMGPPASLSFLLHRVALCSLDPRDERGRRVAAAGRGRRRDRDAVAHRPPLRRAADVHAPAPDRHRACRRRRSSSRSASASIASVPEREPMRTLLEPGAAGILARRALPVIVVAGR